MTTAAIQVQGRTRESAPATAATGTNASRIAMTAADTAARMSQRAQGAREAPTCIRRLLLGPPGWLHLQPRDHVREKTHGPDRHGRKKRHDRRLRQVPEIDVLDEFRD